MSHSYLKIPIPVSLMRICVWFLLRFRKIHFGLAFRKIWLTQGKFTIVDPQDFEKLNAYKWYAAIGHLDNFYAVRKIGRRNGKIKHISMHRFIMNAPTNRVVDHKDGVGLNNTRQNLRIATPLQNNRNCRKTSKKTSSKYKSVCYDRQRNKFRADIKYNGRRKFLGHFENEIDAARAYDQAAKEYYGRFARLNLPQTACPQKHQDLYNQILSSRTERLVNRLSNLFEG